MKPDELAALQARRDDLAYWHRDGDAIGPPGEPLACSCDLGPLGREAAARVTLAAVESYHVLFARATEVEALESGRGEAKGEAHVGTWTSRCIELADEAESSLARTIQAWRDPEHWPTRHPEDEPAWTPRGIIVGKAMYVCGTREDDRSHIAVIPLEDIADLNAILGTEGGKGGR